MSHGVQVFFSRKHEGFKKLYVYLSYTLTEENKVRYNDE